MGLIGNYLVNFLLYAFILNQICFPLVTCQDKKIYICLPKTVYFALLTDPELISDLYPKILVNVKYEDDIDHSKTLAENGDSSEMCLPTVAINAQSTYQKRSLSTLAKNGDLPINLQDRFAGNQDDEEKRTVVIREQYEQNSPGITDGNFLPSNQLNKEVLAESYATEKRNVGALARDFALPPGRRNIASLVRDYNTQTKGNAESHMLPFAGKRGDTPPHRTIPLPQGGKRTIEFISRDYDVPYGKRNIAYLAKTGDFPQREQNKRNNLFTQNWPVSSKRGISVPANVLLKTLSRHGRSLTHEMNTNGLLDFHEIPNPEKIQGNDQENDFLGDNKWSAFQDEHFDLNNRRSKRQIEFSNKCNNEFDYDEMMETLADQYLNAEKRFMGRIPQMGPRPTTPSTRRQGR